MDGQALRNVILCELYEAYFLADGELDLTCVRDRTGYDQNSFRRVVERMMYDGLIRSLGIGRSHKIMDLGIEAVESGNLGHDELVRQNRKAKILILKTLADVFEHEGPEVFIDYHDLAERISLDANLVWANLELLSIHVEWETVDRIAFRISPFGLNRVDGYRQFVRIIQEFEELSVMEPRSRGRALQKLLAKVFAYQGWPQFEGLRTSNEEMDIIVYRGREYYFIECKWEKGPVETEVVDKLSGKLARRPDVKGIIASMSGFSKGSIAAVQGHANTRVILLFGPRDVSSMIHGETMLESLIDDKYREFVTRQKVVFE